MKNITNFIIILIFINFSTSECGEGCLKCTTEDSCLLCDVTKNFKEVNNKCEKVISENCVTINQSGECLACNIGNYIESTSRKCIALDKPIDNCFFYDSTQSCLLCNKNFYLDGTTCKAVEKQVANCDFYILDEQCITCADGYLIDFDSKTCTQTSGIAGCSYFSRVKCNSCLPGYIKNENLYFKLLFKFTSLAEKQIVLTMIGNDETSDLMVEKICEKTSLTDCLEYETFDKCKICTAGYFLIEETGKCQKFPVSVISNCQRYSSFTNCIECSNLFYLKNSSTCSPVTDIENCNEFNGASSTTQCKSCKDEYYLSGSTTCKLRVNIIDKCNVLNTNSDSCSKCADNFEKTSDSLKCLAVVSNCKEYSSSSKSDETLVCSVCKEGFILDQVECKDGTITGCAKYTDSSTFTTQTCEVCNNQFFLADNKCTQMESISNCKTYHKSKDKSCILCEGGYFNFKIESTCKTYTAITNCQTYTPNTTPLTCDKCISGYIKNTEKTSCSKINVENCAVGSSTSVCTECKENYAISGGACFPILDYIGKNCQVSNINNTNSDSVIEKTCTQCKINSLPIQHNDLFVCVNNENISLLFQTTLIPNCNKYNFNGTCNSCLEGKYLKDNECLDTCAEQIHRYDFTNKKRNLCISTADTCKMQADKIDTTGKGCIKCSTGNVFTITYTSNNYTNVKPEMGADLISNPRDVFMMGICVAEAGKTFNQGTTTAGSTPIANCLYYQVRTNTDHLDCVRCKDYHTGVVEQNSAIISCVLDTDFEEGVKKYGLDPIWEKLYSGYSCKGSGKIPFVAYYVASGSIVPTNILGFDPAAQTITGTLKKSNFCSLDRADATVNNNTTMLNNCGMGAYQVENITAKTVNYVCAACKPGYKVTASNSFIKTACAEIENCTGTAWFNSCSQCANGFVYLYSSTEIDYTTCQAYTTNENCYAANSSGTCEICKKGFVLNAAGICDSYTPPNCASSTNFNLIAPTYTFNTNFNLKAFVFYKYQDSIGCGTCKSAHTLIKLESSSYVCTESEYIKTKGNELPDGSPYIKYCESYFYDGSVFKCYKCKTGQLLVNSNNKCVTEIPDCDIASDTVNQCEICKLGFALKNNLCVAGNIDECSEYYLADNNTEMICKQCKEGYFLDSNDTKCVATLVKNCFYPAGLRKCHTCSDGYMRYEQNLYDYCYPMDNAYQCKAATIENNNEYGGSITCTKCELTNDVIVLDTLDNIPVKSICLAFTKTDNCKTHLVSTTFETSSFHCTECEEGYFLNPLTEKCEERVNKPSDCVLYSKTEDLCDNCSITTFKEENGKKCTNFPVGIVGCINYANASSCTGCRENMYLLGKSCENVEDSNLISNCIYYQNGTTCKECKENYLLTNNTCVKANVSNCIKLKTVDSCEVCKNGYGLKETAGKMDCVNVIQSKCITFTPKDPFPCILCEEDYYPSSEGKCVKANPLINDCLIYKDNDTCENCKSGSVLALDKKSCIKGNIAPFIPNSCNSSFISEPFCVTCSGGNVLKNGSCSPCSKNGIATGCFSCDPFNEDKCIVCNTDHYMNKEGTCVALVLPDTNPDDTEFYEKIYVFYVFVLIFMMY